MRISKNRGNAPAFPGTESRFGRCLIPSDRGHIHVGGVQKKGYCHSIVGCFFFRSESLTCMIWRYPWLGKPPFFFWKNAFPIQNLGWLLVCFFPSKAFHCWSEAPAREIVKLTQIWCIYILYTYIAWQSRVYGCLWMFMDVYECLWGL